MILNKVALYQTNNFKLVTGKKSNLVEKSVFVITGYFYATRSVHHIFNQQYVPESLDSDHENHPDNQKYIVKNFQNMPWHKSCPSCRARERIKNALVDKLKHLCTCPNRRVL